MAICRGTAGGLIDVPPMFHREQEYPPLPHDAWVQMRQEYWDAFGVERLSVQKFKRMKEWEKEWIKKYYETHEAAKNS